MIFQSMIALCFLCLFFVFYFTSKSNEKKQVETKNTNVYSQLGGNNPSQKQSTDQKNNFTIILNIGVILIILSSIIFATSTWNIYNNYAKVIILGSETLLFLVLGLILKYVFKTIKSGNALTLISSFLLFATFLSAGYFKLFGDDFSLLGRNSEIFLSVAFLIETLVLFIRKLLIKSNYYLLPLLCFFAALFLLFKGITGDFALAIAIVSVILLLVSLFSKNIFKRTMEFDIFNYVLIGFLTIIYISTVIYQLVSNNTYLLERFSLILLLSSLSINFIVNVGKKNEILNILSIIYESFLVIWFVMFSGNLMTSSFALAISGFVLYIIYYLTKNKYISITSLIISYLQGLLGIILICFDKTYTIAAPIISFTYIILTFISSLKKDNTIILNAIFEPVYLVMFAIGILVQPSIISMVKPIDVIMVINACLIIALIASTLLKNNIKNGYFVILIVGLFVQCICSSYTSVIYSVVTLVINAVLILYSYFSKDSFCEKSTFPISLLFILNILIGLGKHHLVASLLVTVSLILFMVVTKSTKKRFVYASLFFIPVFQIISMTNMRLSIKDDLMLVVLLPFITLFSRRVINSKEETGMCILELLLFSMLSFNIHNNIFSLLYLVVLYVIMCVLSFGWKNSSKVYLNYLLFLTPVMFFMLEAGPYEALYMICVVSSLVINQVLYRLLFEKRSLLFEVFHSAISLILIISLVSTLSFNNILSAIISIILLIILYLIYETEKMRYVVLSFVIYPLSLLIDYIPYQEVSNILNLFIWMIPITIFLRKVFNVDKVASVAIESVTLSLMFLLFIFNINVYVGVTLGIISVILIILGILLKYKSFNYVGCVTLIITIIIQTVSLWGSIPWWVYLLISGIALVIVAAVIESRKK